jgi:hypothetical protein
MNQRWKSGLAMLAVQAVRKRRSERNDGDNDQARDEQNALSSTFHRRIPISMPDDWSL